MRKVVIFELFLIVKRTGAELVLIATVPKSRGLGVIVNGVGPPIGVGDAVGVEVAVLVGVLVGVFVAVLVGVAVFVGVGLAVRVRVGVGLAVGVAKIWISTEPLSQLPPAGTGRG